MVVLARLLGRKWCYTYKCASDVRFDVLHEQNIWRGENILEGAPPRIPNTWELPVPIGTTASKSPVTMATRERRRVGGCHGDVHADETSLPASLPSEGFVCCYLLLERNVRLFSQFRSCLSFACFAFDFLLFLCEHRTESFFVSFLFSGSRFWQDTIALKNVPGELQRTADKVCSKVRLHLYIPHLHVMCVFSPPFFLVHQ